MILRGALSWFLRAIFILLLLVVGTWPLFWPPADQRGVWRTEGSGLILEISRFQVRAYQVGTGYCLPYFSAPAHNLIIGEAADVVLSTQDGRLQIRTDTAIDAVEADPIGALPAECAPPTPASPAAPQAIYDMMWHAVEAHYAFAEGTATDWASQRETLGSTSGEAALWDAMTTALATLEDPQVFLFDPETGDAFTGPPSTKWAPDVLLLRDAVRARGLTPIGDTGVEYAILEGNIGYVFLRHMGTNPGLLTTQADVALSAFAEVSDALADTDAIIIDNRLNPGGAETVALTYARYFTPEPVLAFTKETRTAPSSFTPPREGRLNPIGTLSQPVYLLNSGFTASAAEIFTLALMDLPQVTVMGEPTSGRLSNMIDITLPNGWRLGLPHQRYLDARGVSYQGAGIPPEVALPFDATRLLSGEDALLREALARAQ